MLLVSAVNHELVVAILTNFKQFLDVVLALAHLAVQAATTQPGKY